MLSKFFRSIFAKSERAHESRGRAPKQSYFRARPWLERLEERDVPATFFVTNAADSGSGSLRQAILDANAHPNDEPLDRIEVGFSMAIYLESALPDVNDAVEIYGLEGMAPATITRAMGAPDFRIFTIYPNGEQFILRHLNITGGSASSLDLGGDGGAIWSNGNLTMVDCAVTESFAARNGGGIYHGMAPLTLIDCTFDLNTAGNNGGGVYFQSGGAQDLTISGCTITNNTAANNGGGVFYDATGNVDVIDSDISFNVAVSGKGGGICCEVVRALSITGGGLFENYAGTNGGAFYAFAVHVYVSTSTGGGGSNHAGNPATSDFLVLLMPGGSASIPQPPWVGIVSGG